MAINNINVVLFENEKEVNDIREMGEIEIAGALAYVYSLVKEFENLNFGECFLTFGEVNGSSYYCGKKLHLNDNQGYVIDAKDDKDLVIDHMFMREGSYDVLWGYAYWLDRETEEESDLFLVRM